MYISKEKNSTVDIRYVIVLNHVMCLVLNKY